MMRPNWLLVLRGFLASLPAVLLFVVVAPLAGRYLDREFGWGGLIPAWLSILGWPFLAAGITVCLWTFVLFAIVGQGTPNPLLPPVCLVDRGPYRFSRNPMMLGGWIVALSLSAILRSPGYAAITGIIVAMGVLFIRLYEEPWLRRRYGAAYEEYSRRTPRWICPC